MTACPLCGSDVSDPYFEKDGYHLVRCRMCDLVRVANPPGDDELDRYYSFAAGYGVESRDDRREIMRLERLASHHLRQLAQLARPPGRLLDVGCAAGFFLAAAAHAGWDVEGLELNVDSAALAEARTGFRIVRGSLDRAHFAASSYDAVTLWDVLEHVRDPRRTLDEVHRVLRPAGTIALSTPNLRGLFPRLSRPLGRISNYWTHPEPPAHLFQFSIRTIERLFRVCGFQTLTILHDRTPLRYTLAPGGLRRTLRSPGRALYAVTFALPLLVGPRLRAGDEITVLARRVAPSSRGDTAPV